MSLGGKGLINVGIPLKIRSITEPYYNVLFTGVMRFKVRMDVCVNFYFHSYVSAVYFST
jgi:hypothetical protein